MVVQGMIKKKERKIIYRQTLTNFL